MSQLPIAAQMYTVREVAAQNLPHALERVAKIGYPAVELAGLFGHDASKIAQILQQLGLTCVSAHVSLADLKNNLAQQIETYQMLNAEFLVCPWLPPKLRGNESNYRTLAKELNQIGRQCRANGLQFCYHHHEFEFAKFNGKYALDILLKQSDPANVQLEADTYWIKYGGEEPASYIRRWSGRIPLIHFKDMTATEPPTFAEVGAGTLNWSSIFEAAQASQTQWYIVEQDTCPGDPFESLAISFEKVRELVG